ncbi:reverse transcriptase domain-containing protein [Tanacetum coccineum]
MEKNGHYTNDCFQLRRQLESALESDKLNHLIKDVKQRGRGNTKGREGGKDKVINMIQSWADGRKRKTMEKEESWMKTPIVFPAMSLEDISDEPMIIEAVMEGYLVRRIHVDQGASVEVMFEHCFENLSPAIESRLKSTQTDLMGFSEDVVKPLGMVEVEAVFGYGGLFRRVSMNFTVIRAPSPYNIILERTGLKTLLAVASTIHSMKKENGRKRGLTEPSPCGDRVKRKHSLNANLTVEPFCQKRRVLAPNRSQAVIKEVEEWLKAGIVRLVRYPTWISNPVLVKKRDGSWRMCIDFKNINSACPKDYYPLSDIDGKIESVIGFRYKCFLDAYKGYHQVQMTHDDEEKTAFYTDQCTYCYTKMSFGLKNAGATYQRLVDTAFQSQIGRNLEVYVNDMVIKSNDEKMLLADVAETFDNLRRINMKLNPKKCSFGVEEGKFLGYMVTSKGI